MKCAELHFINDMKDGQIIDANITCENVIDVVESVVDK